MIMTIRMMTMMTCSGDVDDDNYVDDDDVNDLFRHLSDNSGALRDAVSSTLLLSHHVVGHLVHDHELDDGVGGGDDNDDDGRPCSEGQGGDRPLHNHIQPDVLCTHIHGRN